MKDKKDFNFQKVNEELLEFLDHSPNAFWAVENMRKILEKEGYLQLREADNWNLTAGGKYYVIRNGSAIIAFQTPADSSMNISANQQIPADSSMNISANQQIPADSSIHASADQQIPADGSAFPLGFQIMTSHSDSPAFKIKTNAEIEVDKTYIKLNTEKYGGMLFAPWMDRPLSVAGRVLVDTANGIESRLVNIDRDLFIIPNLAIHMDRQVNEGYKFNAQVDMLPLMGDVVGTDQVCNEADREADREAGREADREAGREADREEDSETMAAGSHAENEKNNSDIFLRLIAEATGVNAEQILDTDLFLYNRMKGTTLGANGEYIASGRLDDLQCAFASLQGFLQAKPTKSIPVHCVYDNEEVGSGTKQGAASTFLKDTLHRIVYGLGGDENRYLRMLASSFMVSADNAHAVHPNHTDKADPTNRPYMNKGIVIKYSANQKYTTDGVSGALFRKICDRAQVPVQTFTNRSDMLGGSTLGNISQSQVALNTVDIGLPQLAMHSSYETAGAKDTAYLVTAARELYSIAILDKGNGNYEIQR